MYAINRAYKDETTGSIFHEVGGYPHFQYRAIRAGLSWPLRSSPAYYCIFGQLTYQNEFKRYPLVFMGEGESKDLEKLFQRLTDDATKVLCESIYADIANESECYQDAFSDFCSETETRGLGLLQAPWPESFQYGVNLIHECLSKNALQISGDSILRQQLGKISESAFGEKPEETFWAVNALRHVVSSYKKFGVGEGMTQAKADEMRRRYGPPGIL